MKREKLVSKFKFLVYSLLVIAILLGFTTGLLINENGTFLENLVKPASLVLSYFFLLILIFIVLPFEVLVFFEKMVYSAEMKEINKKKEDRVELLTQIFVKAALSEREIPYSYDVSKYWTEIPYKERYINRYTKTIPFPHLNTPSLFEKKITVQIFFKLLGLFLFFCIFCRVIIALLAVAIPSLFDFSFILSFVMAVILFLIYLFFERVKKKANKSIRRLYNIEMTQYRRKVVEILREYSISCDPSGPFERLAYKLYERSKEEDLF